MALSAYEETVQRASEALASLRHMLADLGPAPLVGDLFIFIDDLMTYNVSEHYRRRGFAQLPPTPTMRGAEIIAASGKDPCYQVFCDDPWNEYWLDRHIADSEAVPLISAMRFYIIPPATNGCRMPPVERQVLDWAEIHSRYRRQDYSVCLWSASLSSGEQSRD